MLLKLPITALVVGHNEGHLLKNSLPKLSFCNEIIYVDLESNDDSVTIAKTFNAQIIHHPKVNHVEIIHTELASSAKNDWILITDPDEVLADALVNDIIDLFQDHNLNTTIGAITAPIIFHFKKQALKGTHWGGVLSRILLIQKDRFIFLPAVHAGRKLKDECVQMDIPFNGENYIHHYWMDSYRKLFKKHLRYLKNEGETRYNQGRLVNFWQMFKEPHRNFKYSYWVKAGYKDGIKGFFLSVFWVWYESAAQWRTYRYQKKH